MSFGEREKAHECREEKRTKTEAIARIMVFYFHRSTTTTITNLGFVGGETRKWIACYDSANASECQRK